MKRGRPRKNLEWQYRNPVWRSAHEDNLKVFGRIRWLSQKKDPPSVECIIDCLKLSEDYGECMHSKSKPSWKRSYYRWMKERKPKMVTPCK